MSQEEFEFDLFLSYASEDAAWCEHLAERLRDQGIRVWFDTWRLQPGHNLDVELNKAIPLCRKMVAVWSEHYFRKTWTQVEIFGRLHGDPLSQERPVIPVCIVSRDKLAIPPTLRPLLSLDFTNPEDEGLRVRQLIEALDLPDRRRQAEDRPDFRMHELDARERGREANRAGKRFEDEVSRLYRVLGWDVTQDTQVSGIQIDVQIRKRDGGLTTEAVVECKDKRIGAAERDQLLAQQNVAQKNLPRHRWIAVSSQGFAADTRAALDGAGFDCTTYSELLQELVPLGNYVENLIAEYEERVGEQWHGNDWFIRPDLLTDITAERHPAVTYLAKWLGDERSNLLVVLGDLGTGKTTLASFLAYQLARSFRDDPLRHPAPVLIPLREVRKEVSLDSIVVKHFRDRGLSGVNFQRFEHLLREGRIVLFFDAFDEMADRVKWEVTQSNFQELRRAAEGRGKVVLTCRTHYFKDRTEQTRLIGHGPSLTEAETALYKELRQQSNAEVVYLQEFSEEQIREYLGKTRGSHAEEDWARIQRIYNLRDLAQRPLLLDMIVKSLPHIKEGEQVNAASLYKVYTNLWVERDHKRGRVVLDRETKLALMMELAWWMWREDKSAITTPDLVAFVGKLHSGKSLDFADEEIEDITREVQAASFLRRDHAGNFTFMHRSFGEFFLARKILAAHAPDGAEPDMGLHPVLNARRYDRKTIYFLTLLDESDALRTPLAAILTGPYTQNVSENALQMLYWSGRTRCDVTDKVEDAAQFSRLRKTLSDRIPSSAKLNGADLPEIVLECATLTDADLRAAVLTAANFNGAVLARSHLESANLSGTRFENTVLDEVDLRGADLSSTIWTGAGLIRSDLREARFDPAALATATIDQVRCVGLGCITHDSLRPVAQLGSAIAVRAAAWSPEGDLLAIGSGDGVIRLYRVSDGRLLRTLEGHINRVLSVAFAPEGGLIASGSDDKTVRLWQSDTGKHLRTLKGHTDSVWSVAFAPEGGLIASGSDDKTVRLWQSDTGKHLRTLKGHTGWVRSVAFAPEGGLIASGSGDKTVRLWQSDTGKPLRTLEGHTSGVRSVAFAPQGGLIASGSGDKTVRLWQSDTGKPLRTLEGHTSGVLSVAFAPQGGLIASGSGDKTVRLWQSDTGEHVRTLEGHTNWVRSAAFAPQGGLVASGSDDETVRLWQCDTGKHLRTLQGHTSGVQSVAFAPQGGLIASRSYDHTIRLWQSDTGKHVRTLEGHTSGVLSVAFAPQGGLIASGSYDKTIRLWQSDTGKHLRTLEGHPSGVLSVAFAPQGGLIASGSYDKTIRLWQSDTGKQLRTLEGHTDWVSNVAFSPQGGVIASGSRDHTVRLWQSDTGKPLRTLEGHTNWVQSVAFAPQGGRIASGSDDKTVRLWQSDTGKHVRTLKGHTNWVQSVAFAPQGGLIASGSNDNTVRLWQSDTGKHLRTLEGHLGPIHSVAFAPDGRYLVAAGAAGRLQFWDYERGETFLYLYAPAPGAWLALLPDGRFDSSPEGLRYLCYTEQGTFNSYTAEEVLKEFHDPQAVREVLARYAVPPPPSAS